MTIAFWLCDFSLIAIFLTGYIGYFVVDKVWPSFYYAPVTDGKNVWLFLQLGCMFLFAAGVVFTFREISHVARS
jgi:hypothetical protein